MKTKLIIPIWLLFASMLCNVPALQMYAQSTDITSAQREVSKLSKQKKSLTEKYDKAKQDYEDAQAKVKTNQDKPNSLAYKSAVKKAETSKEKMSSIQNELKIIDQELVVAIKNTEQAQQLQLKKEALEKAEKEKAAAEKQVRKEKKRKERLAAKYERNDARKQNIEDIELSIDNQDKKDECQEDTTNINRTEKTIVQNDTFTISALSAKLTSKVTQILMFIKSKSTLIWTSVKIVFWIFIGIFVIICVKAIFFRGGERSSYSTAANSETENEQWKGDECDRTYGRNRRENNKINLERERMARREKEQRRNELEKEYARREKEKERREKEMERDRARREKERKKEEAERRIERARKEKEYKQQRINLLKAHIEQLKGKVQYYKALARKDKNGSVKRNYLSIADNYQQQIARLREQIARMR